VDVVALILWILTAGGGFVLLATWISKGGARRDGAGSNFPQPLIFGHFLLAAIGLVLWIAYVATDNDTTGWIAFVLLAVVALLGFTMFARWLPTYRATRSAGAGSQPSATAGAGTSGVATSTTTTSVQAPAERHFPVPIVVGHGLLAATTLVLVLLTMLGVGGS
jgi:uncharacterized membrane-anchored protein